MSRRGPADRRVVVAALAAMAWVGIAAIPASAADRAERDPRNWPTLTRLIADRYEIAGRIVTLRVHARRSDYYNCGYRHGQQQLMAFTLLGGPLETLTGYVRRDLGELLDRELARDPWLPITVQVRFDPERLSEACTDQVDILKWSIGWHYPPGSLSPGRPDPTMSPTADVIDDAEQSDLWRVMNGRRARRFVDGKRLTSEALLGRTIELTAGARADNAYHCLYRGATRTHYSVRLHNARGDIVHAYLDRTPEARQLMDVLALHRDVLVQVQGRVVRQVPSNYCHPQLEITGWTFPEAAAP